MTKIFRRFMKQLVSLLRTTAKPCITGARLNHGHEELKAEPAVGNQRADVNAAAQNFGQRTKDGCSSPSWHSSALPHHAEPGTRDGPHRPSWTAIGQAPAGAMPPKPALHNGWVLMNTAGLHHPHLWCQGKYRSRDIAL